ncbi:strubbelig-receptor family [Musa troglodytarum]|nr:strubbelig-receptor family [Musa troglodytarum]
MELIRYLHEVCAPSVVHKNIKSSNILLDAELNPHLADCGLAVFFECTLFSKPRTEQSLVRWAASQLHDIDALAQMMDPASLRQSHCLDLLMSSLSVFRPEPEFRPAMSEVVQSLVRCVQRTSIGKRMGRDLNTSRRSNDSNHGYY